MQVDPWVGNIHWWREWLPIPVFLPGKSNGQSSLVGYGSWSHKELDTTECTQATINQSVQSLSRVWVAVTPWTAAVQASLSITNSRSLLKLMSSKSVMLSSHLILCRPLLLLPSNFPSISVFSIESVVRIRWPKYWSFSFSISPSNEYSGLISFRMDWLNLLTVQDCTHTNEKKREQRKFLREEIVLLSHRYVLTSFKTYTFPILLMKYFPKYAWLRPFIVLATFLILFCIYYHLFLFTVIYSLQSLFVLFVFLDPCLFPSSIFFFFPSLDCSTLVSKISSAFL